ncbi:MAG: hypothetical protein WCK28_21975, partial [Burkholderiales bacterium]
MAQKATQRSPVVGDIFSVFSALSVIARDANRALRNADAAVPKIEYASEYVQGNDDFLFNEMMFVSAKVAMAVRATERLHSQNPLIRDGIECAKIDLNPPGVKGGLRKWHQPTANPYFAAFCDPVFSNKGFFARAAEAHLLRDGSPLRRLLSRVDTDAAFLRIPPIAEEKKWGNLPFPNHPSEAISRSWSSLLSTDAVVLNFIRLGRVCDEELFLRMADFRLAASPNTGQAVMLIMLESLVAELLEQWPAAAVAGGN